MATSKETLKAYFDTGKKPTGQEFTELIDAFVHRGDDLQALLGRIAEISEAEGGEVNNKYMTPFLTLKAIVALVRLANVPGLKAEVGALDEAVKTDLTALMTSKDEAVKTDVEGKIDAAINALKGGASSAYDTLLELQTELQDNDSALDSLLTAVNERYSKTELDAFFEGTSSGKKQVNWASIAEKPSAFTPDAHSHDDRYYTESELDAFFEGTSSGKKQVNWASIAEKPSAFTAETHNHSSGEINGLHAVATSGDYNNLINKPSLSSNSVRFRTRTSVPVRVYRDETYYPPPTPRGEIRAGQTRRVATGDYTYTLYLDCYTNQDWWNISAKQQTSQNPPSAGISLAAPAAQG